MDIDPTKQFENLSGGLKRRVLLAQSLVNDPHLLLLDEPTNHLDIAAVDWLEAFLLGTQCAIIFITHDREFLNRIATRIVEVDRGKLHNYPGNYNEFCRYKQEALLSEQKSNNVFDKKMAEEEVWIRRGVKARTKRNQGRVRALEEMRSEAAQRRKHYGRSEIKAQFGEISSKRVFEARNLSVTLNDQVITEKLTLKIQRGITLGIMGPNGSGKTTLLRALMGDLPPSAGHIKFGENLQIAYFDQNRQALDLEKPARWNVNNGHDKVLFDGNDIHVIGYLKSFLFTAERSNTKTKLLSGGERNRLLLARLFAQPSNVLILDEPTNDLDVETLELLENLVHNYPGTCLIVSHDRAFINNVVEGLLVHEGKELGFQYYVGNYEDWLRQRQQPAAAKEEKAKVITPSEPAKAAKPVKLSYKEQRELEQLPKQIEVTETALNAIQAEMATAEFFQQDAATIKATQLKMSTLETQLQDCFDRWEKLESH